MPHTLIMIGGGNMGSAILRGNHAAKLFPREHVIVVEPDATKAPALTPLAATVVGSASMLAATDPSTTLLVLGVKPQVFPTVARELAERKGQLQGVLVASIMAGIPLARLREDCPWASSLVRLMPNLPASIGRGITALCHERGTPGGDHNATPPDISRVRTLFERVGAVIDIDEPLIDAFTAVAGSGPAYLFLLAEAMVAGARAAGFSQEQAGAIVRATIAGSAAMLESDQRDPEMMRQAVTSKGGTTEAALNVLNQAGWALVMEHAILAARDRAKQLAH
jgi:pyrroline-5-carboxylate reductase